MKAKDGMALHVIGSRSRGSGMRLWKSGTRARKMMLAIDVVLPTMLVSAHASICLLR